MKTFTGSWKPGEKTRPKTPRKMNEIGKTFAVACPALRSAFISRIQELSKQPEMLAVFHTRFVKFWAYEKVSALPLSVINSAYDVLGLMTSFKRNSRPALVQIDFAKLHTGETVRVQLYESVQNG